MPDRSLRLLTFPPQPGQEGARGTVLLRERPSTPPQAPSDRKDEGARGETQDENPFAPPAEGTPDSPWRPRSPSGSSDDQHSSGGNQWSDRQPGRSPGGFGERPRGGPEGPGGPGKLPGMRWDPTDPAQRRARFSLLGGMWAFFFALFGWPYVALLLGALAFYWAVSALRAKPRKPDPDTAPQDQTGRPQNTAAVSGLVTASLALALVAASFTVQLVYRDYYTCVDDALTSAAEHSCEKLLPQGDDPTAKLVREMLSSDS